MLIVLLINLINLIIGAIFSLFPVITTLPTIAGFDIDGALTNGMNMTRFMFTAFWPLQVIFQGLLVLLGYYVMKLTFTLILGHRNPIKD